MVRLPLHSRDAPKTATLSLNRPFSIICNETQERFETELNREELAGAGQPARMYLKYRLGEETSQRVCAGCNPRQILNSGYFRFHKTGFGIFGTSFS